ncbi:RNA polymerase sigma factor RpoH [Tepidimonas charontis]|uniref:RNA polymerase sigma factor RpoH n=1 Tax=Tepidimonas charontis TaxID=2267262 RepID=A0A554XB64_9BURK|nr:RNA polymerase sigma factor RpoH [Tepidimonas charontis]TSE33075.1 RNA polymerase sigma factor RpoH [Tepidimonas charontis]
MAATSVALTPTSSAAVAALPAWSSTSLTLPPLGHLDAYISAVNRIPMLSAEEERECARRWQREHDLEAAGKLVLSHLRLVVAISRQYLGYGLPQADLIQEGNVGLMKAVKRFDPEQGVRLVSYAVHWIKAEIHEFILRNWRMVKIATTKAQRKLFFNLRALKRGLKADASDEDAVRERLSEAEIEAVARELNVRREDVIEMETRMAGSDVVLDPLPSDDGEEVHAPIAYLADQRTEPTAVLEARERERLSSEGIEHALAQLDERSRRIVTARWLQVNDDGTGGATLHELAAEFGVSAERIRQIEAAALKKLRKALEAYA